MYNTGERSKPEKNYNNKIKTTFEFPPSPTHQTFTQDPISDKYIWMGGGGFRTPVPPSGSAYEILLPLKIRWIMFSSFRIEVENVPANQWPGGHLVFPICPKTQTCRARWDLVSCQVSLISAPRFQRSRKCEKFTTTDGRTTENAWSQ